MPITRNKPSQINCVTSRKYYDYIIGVDPDVDKNGMATLNRQTKEITTIQCSFPQLLDCLRIAHCAAKEIERSLVVVVEAGYLNRSNWHTAGKSVQVSTAIGNQTGRNHEVARKIIEMCRHYEIEVVEQKPLKKIWGADGKQKISHTELAQFAHIVGRTNQETRDAALIAWNFAGLAMRVRALGIKNPHHQLR